MNRLFESIISFFNGIEDSLINTLSIVVPWFVPVIPAYLTFRHSEINLQFPVWVAWTAAFVVEVLGLASMRTAVTFYEHNRRYSKDVKKAPFNVAILIYAFYLAVVLVVNVLLDWKNGVVWWNVLAIGLFSLLSVPAAALISVRAQHTELLRQLDRERSERRQIRSESRRKVSESTGKVSETYRNTGETLPKDWRKLRPTLSDQEVSNLAILNTEQVKELSQRYGVEEKTVYNWRMYAKRELERRN